MNMVCHSIYLSLLSTVSYGFQCTNLSLPKEPFALPCLSYLSQGWGRWAQEERECPPSPLFIPYGYL